MELAGKARWSRDTALEYLASNPHFRAVKPLQEYSTPYLKRQASALQDAERAGREAPSNKERRGHGPARIEHISRDKHHLEQYIVEKPKRRDLDMRDIANLLEKTKGKGNDVWVVIRGKVQYSPLSPSKKDLPVQTLTFRKKWSSMKNFIDHEPHADIRDFAYDCSQLIWESVESVGFAYGGKE